MPAWSRSTILPQQVSPLRIGGALQSISQSGKSQRRSTQHIGRNWTEVYKPFKVDSDAGKDFLAMVMDYWRNGTQFTIDHRLYQTKRGSGTGTPLVNGASQTGSVLNTDGWTGSNPVLRKGDLIKLQGLNQVFELVADAPNLASGATSLNINPPIFVGGSPADNAVITYTGVTFDAYILEISDIPNIPPGGILQGLTISFVEAL